MIGDLHRRRRLPVVPYPVMLALLYIATRFISSGVSPFAAIRVSLVVLAAAVLVTIATTALMRDRDHGELIAALVIMALIPNGDLRISVLLLLLVGTTIGILHRSRHPSSATWKKVTRTMTALTVILAMAVCLQAVQLGAPGVVIRAFLKETGVVQAPHGTSNPRDPDIVMVMLDGHTSPDVMTKQFAGDGVALTSALQQRGFAVNKVSHSNYPLTTQTLSSMFNMSQLREMPAMAHLSDGTLEAEKGRIVRDSLNDNAVFPLLRARDYRIEAIASGWEEVSMREADRFIDGGEINEFEVDFLQRTAFGPLLDLMGSDWPSAQHRARIDEVFAATVASVKAARETPGQALFLFAHVPSPHPPWVVTRTGSPRTSIPLRSMYSDTELSTRLTEGELKQAYEGQMAFVDDRLLSMLDSIDGFVDVDARPTVTIVFSDHGSWIGAEQSDHRLRLANLMAIRSSGVRLLIPTDMTPVNLFPIVFDQVFGMDLPEQPNDAYVFDGPNPFALKEVDLQPSGSLSDQSTGP